jgi:glycosyltransferase involved in cell wall biosynthesis
MIIAIDGNEANIKARVGVNIYAFELLKAIYKLQDEWKGKYKFVIFLAQKPLSDMPKEVRDLWEYQVLPGKGLWVLTSLMPRLWLNKQKVDLLFSPSHYTVPILVIPRICSIMDLGYLEFSEQFEKKVFWQLKLWTAISIIVSKHIIAISHKTANDIVRHYPFASKKISVTHLGFDHKKFNPQIPSNDVRRIRQRYHIVDDYILFLGTLKPSKNVAGLLQAFSLLTGEFPLYKLVIAGKKGWMYEQIFKKVEELDLREKVIFTDYVVEQDKPPLMAGAKVFVCPSFWEGFGLIALESMASGTPVVVSDLGSFPEVVGKAGILVDPKSPPSIASGIRRVLKMSASGYNKLVSEVIAQAAGFSWDKTARETLKVFENLKHYRYTRFNSSTSG